MPHKFVPRKSFGRKEPTTPEPSVPETQVPEPDLSQPSLSDPGLSAPTAPEPPALDPASSDNSLTAPSLPEPPGDEPTPAVEKPAGVPPLGGKVRSAKDSILKKLPGKGARKPFSKLNAIKKEAIAPRMAVRTGMPTGMLLAICGVVFLLVAGGIMVFIVNQVPGYRTETVKHATRLDWIFVEGKKSKKEPDAIMSTFDAGNDSLKQRYELYVPRQCEKDNPEYDKDKKYPVILYLSPEAKPSGWSSWKTICQKYGVIFASPYGVGEKERPNLWERTRIALDVLDDVRRKYPNTDPDCTYVVGSEGSARLACHLGFALPELFGGVVAISGGDLPRDEPWMRQRVAERLSVAWIARSEKDPSKLEIEKLYKPFLQDGLNVRCKEWYVEGQGKSIPEEKLEEVYQWLEVGAKDRHKLAAKYPATSMPGDAAWQPADQVKLVFAEAMQRIKDAEDKDKRNYFVGYEQLRGALGRWEDLPAANKEISEVTAAFLNEHGKVQKTPWYDEHVKFLYKQDQALARALTAYLTGKVDQVDPARQQADWERRNQWFTHGIDLWNKIIQDPSSGADKAEAEKGRADLEKAKLGTVAVTP
jgi:hypothetical protein